MAMPSKMIYFKELIHLFLIFYDSHIMCRQLKDRINHLAFDFREDKDIGVESALLKQYITIEILINFHEYLALRDYVYLDLV